MSFTETKFGQILETLPRLIQMKRAAGRPKDLWVLAELVALLEEKRKDEGAKGG